jgi:hypothetical protein
MFERKRLTKTTWVKIDELGFELQLRYLPRSEMRQMLEKATETKWDRSGQPREKVNVDILLAELAAYIVDWRGLSREVYARLLPIDPEDYPEEIPCTQEYKRELLSEAYGLDNVVREICTDLARFQEAKLETEIKN